MSTVASKAPAYKRSDSDVESINTACKKPLLDLAENKASRRLRFNLPRKAEAGSAYTVANRAICELFSFGSQWLHHQSKNPTQGGILRLVISRRIWKLNCHRILRRARNKFLRASSIIALPLPPLRGSAIGVRFCREPSKKPISCDMGFLLGDPKPPDL